MYCTAGLVYFPTDVLAACLRVISQLRRCVCVFTWASLQLGSLEREAKGLFLNRLTDTAQEDHLYSHLTGRSHLCLPSGLTTWNRKKIKTPGRQEWRYMVIEALKSGNDLKTKYCTTCSCTEKLVEHGASNTMINGSNARKQRNAV